MEYDALGLDFGGVILDWIPHRGGERDFSGDNFLQTPEVPDAIESIAELHASRFPQKIFLVSRVYENPDRSLAWLEHVDFWNRTGIAKEHFNWCLERHEKSPICRELGITHFVDDRTEVLSHMDSVENLYPFQSLDIGKFPELVDRLHPVNSWEELTSLLRA